jgi:CysZ protein
MWLPDVRLFVWVPLIINILVVVGLFSWLWPPIQHAVDGWLAQLPSWLLWLGFLVWPVLWLLAMLAFILILTITANLVAAPFNGFLAARVEAALTGLKPDSGLGLWQEGLLGLATELRKLSFFLLWAVPLVLLSLLLFFLPGLNFLIPVLWGVFGAYMLALEYVDYPAANHGLSFAEKRRVLAKDRWLTLGFGAAVTLATAVPLLNLLVMPAAVAGATAMWVEHLHKETVS